MAAPIEYDGDIILKFAAWMRFVGLNTLDAALKGEPSTLDDVLDSSWMQWIWRTAGNVAALAGRSTTAFDQTLQHIIYSDDPISSPAWQQLVAAEIDRLCDRDLWLQVPEHMWAIVFRTAWGNPKYQFEVARAVEATVRRRTLFASKQLPSFLLSAQTSSLLLAMALGQISNTLEQQSMPRLGLPKRKRFGRREISIVPLRKYFARIKEVAEKQVERETGWARLWDQWVLLQAREHWPHASLARNIHEELDRLPLAMYRQHGISQAVPDTTMNVFASPDCADPSNMPSWIAFEYSTSRSQERSSTER